MQLTVAKIGWRADSVVMPEFHWTIFAHRAIFPPNLRAIPEIKGGNMIKQIFAWWDSTTLGTSLTLFRKGAKLIGKDEQGNRYFEETGKPSFADGRKRRWVVYHGIAEPSRVPADWHGWLHHTFDAPPTEAPLHRQKFEIDHLPNMTGTPLAYHPKGSLYLAGKPEEAGVASDYEAWSPGD